ncbi:hypothetical protein [Dictyobacter kobayashii]|uniref:Uncharacterized protein n=1 Tax=Dictyobacter kobayashii TaxID=2014872 RepID=A0A402AGL5_9CHLR|nr:hypothetical protein [Dictyobacter kobayashii]GCE18252.1 hypothetical protein KDK_20520 [Dictyobacter kobayashii]
MSMQTHTTPKLTIQQRFLIISFFLILSLGATIIATNATINAVQNVHQHQVMAHKGDVHLIRQWMTIPYVAHVYQVPDTILYSSLKLKNDAITRHSTLQTIALQRKQPPETVISKLQTTILEYRKLHPFKPYPTPSTQRGESITL